MNLSPYDQHWADWKARFASQHAQHAQEPSRTTIEPEVEIVRTSVKRSTDTLPPPPPEPSTPKKKPT